MSFSSLYKFSNLLKNKIKNENPESNCINIIFIVHNIFLKLIIMSSTSFEGPCDLYRLLVILPFILPFVHRPPVIFSSTEPLAYILLSLIGNIIRTSKIYLTYAH